eukprot:842714-Amphidinium_carterae.1
MWCTRSSQRAKTATLASFPGELTHERLQAPGTLWVKGSKALQEFLLVTFESGTLWVKGSKALQEFLL